VAEQIHELKLTMRNIEPPIWRRVAIPSDASLGVLHDVIQVAMGWDDDHLHEFVRKTGAKPRRRPLRLPFDLVGMVDRGEQTFTDHRVEGMDGEDEGEFTLRDVCPQPKSKLCYRYDFGDGWEVDIRVVKLYEPAEGVTYPLCLAGERAGPPDDCGGVYGYYGLIEASQTPDDPESQERLEWLGGPFDPDAFDLKAINHGLAWIAKNWKPQPTPAPKKRPRRPRRRE